MRTYLAWLLAAVALPLTAYAQEATIKEVHDQRSQQRGDKLL